MVISGTKWEKVEDMNGWRIKLIANIRIFRKK